MGFEETKLLHKDLTDRILHWAIEVHKTLGPGLLESTYEACLFDELHRDGLTVVRQVELPILYKDRLIECGYRIDLLVEKNVIVEVKSVDKLAPIHSAQLLTYLRLAGVSVGLLLNFNVKLLPEGIVRKVLTTPMSPSALSASSVVNPNPGAS